MTLFYNIGIRLYYVFVLFASLFNGKAKLWIKGRKGVLKRLSGLVEHNTEYIWVHVSSLGEFEQGRPLMESLKVKFPKIKIILTFFSPSGYEVKKNYSGADIICYLPLDTKLNAKRFIKIVKPKYTFFIKYEYWYNFLKQAKKSDSKLYLVSGIFRENQLFFKWYGGWYRKILGYFDHLFVQNEESASMLESIGLKQYTVTGDSRFDRVVQIANQSKEIKYAQEFSNGSLTVVCGSTWEPDEDIITQYINQSDNKIKFIIAPHEISNEKVENLIKKLKVRYVRFSMIGNEDLQLVKVMIIDNIGMLSSIYKYGKVAYIGGGFGAGIHNTLEAAVFNIPIIFGPNYKKFNEAVELIKKGGSYSIVNYDEFKQVLDTLIDSEKLLLESGANAGNYVQSKTGATQTIIEYLY